MPAHSFSPSRVSLFHRRLLCSLPLRRASLLHRQLLCFARSLFLSIAHLFSIANYSGYRCCHPRHIFANHCCSHRRRTLSIHRCCHPRIFLIHRYCHCRCALASQSATTIATTAASISYPNQIAPAVRGGLRCYCFEATVFLLTAPPNIQYSNLRFPRPVSYRKIIWSHICQTAQCCLYMTHPCFRLVSNVRASRTSFAKSSPNGSVRLSAVFIPRFKLTSCLYLSFFYFSTSYIVGDSLASHCTGVLLTSLKMHHQFAPDVLNLPIPAPRNARYTGCRTVSRCLSPEEIK